MDIQRYRTEHDNNFGHIERDNNGDLCLYEDHLSCIEDTWLRAMNNGSTVLAEKILKLINSKEKRTGVFGGQKEEELAQAIEALKKKIQEAEKEIVDLNGQIDVYKNGGQFV